LPSAKHHFLLGGLAVLLVSLALRVYAMTHTDVIQRDGVTFIGIARIFSEHGLRPALAASHQHVGFPILTSAAHRALFSGHDDPEGWEHSGQYVSLAAGVAATLGVWALTGLTLDWGLAWVSGLLFAVGRKWVSLGADVMSDASALCAFVWSINCGLLAIRAKTLRGGLAWGALSGALAGAGYWIRPEAGGAAVVIGGTVLAAMATRKVARKRGLSILAVLALALLATAGPYAVMIGGLTSKTHGPTADASPFAFDRGLPLAAATTGPASDRNAVYALLSQTVEAMNPVAFGLFAFGLLSAAVHFSLPVAARKDYLTFPRNPEGWAILLAVVLYVPVLLRLHAQAGYLDWRHCMPLALVLAPLAGSGMGAYLRWFAFDVFKKPALLSVFWIILFPVALGGAAYPSLTPIHSSTEYIREAARYLRRNVHPPETICVNATLIRHYAELPGDFVNTTELNLSTMRDVLARRKMHPDWLALSDRWLATEHGSLPPAQFELMRTFKRNTTAGEEPDHIRIYRIHWEAP
jgi:hypothetical protein